MSLFWLVLTVFWGFPYVCQDAAENPKAETAPAAAEQNPLERIIVIGASATHGFGTSLPIDSGDPDKGSRPIKLADVIDASLNSPHQPLVSHSDLFFFARPTKTGPRFIALAKEAEPTLVIGVDLLFWYGYGAVGADGSPITQEQDRLELLEAGLAELAKLDCPVIVGDFPDMSSAVGRMLSPAQMPAPKTLVTLNKRLREWADEHDNVMVFSLSTFVSKCRSNEHITIGQTEWPKGSAKVLIQSDQLHPTVDGQIAMTQVIADILLQGNEAVQEGQFELDREKIMQRLKAQTKTNKKDHQQKAKQEVEAKEKAADQVGVGNRDKPRLPSSLFFLCADSVPSVSLW